MSPPSTQATVPPPSTQATVPPPSTQATVERTTNDLVQDAQVQNQATNQDIVQAQQNTGTTPQANSNQQGTSNNTVTNNNAQWHDAFSKARRTPTRRIQSRDGNGTALVVGNSDVNPVFIILPEKGLAFSKDEDGHTVPDNVQHHDGMINLTNNTYIFWQTDILKVERVDLKDPDTGEPFRMGSTIIVQN